MGGLLGVLILDRDPYVFADFPGLAQAWLQDAGGFAFAGLLVYVLYALLMPADQAKSAKDRAGVSSTMLVMLVLALVCYVAAAVLIVGGIGVDKVNVKVYSTDPGMYIKYQPPEVSYNLQPVLLTLGGLFALIGIGLPFVKSLAKIRYRRLAALTILGFREAWRSRLFWVFLLILLPFLVPANWFVQIKPENELRSTLAIISLFMNILLLLPAALLASLSIPTEIKNQNLYTVVTKPVERFEIVFGRFVGYVTLMTVAIALVTGVSWLFIRTTSFDEKSQAESFKARVPVRGAMKFMSRKQGFEGTNVGREFDYRRYIAGAPNSPQRAVWGFDELPAVRPGQESVPCEFTFDIYRMTKGVENRGVDVTVRATTWQTGQKPPTEPGDPAWKWTDPAREKAYVEEAKRLVRELKSLPPGADVNPAELSRARPGTPEWKAVNELARKFGFFEIAGKELYDYRTSGVDLPAGLVELANEGTPPGEAGRREPRLRIYVNCTTGGQMLGMAEGDLYLLEGQRGFSQNYFKAAVGLWCRVVIVIGLAVVLSTYLTFVVAFLGAALIFLSGYGIEHITDVSSGQSYAGGPFKALTNLLKAETPTAQADPNSAVTNVTGFSDQFVAWVFRRVVNMIPDVESYSWTNYVSEGFDVPAECLVMNVVVTAAYLLPWFILGYYLMRSREVAA